MSTDLEFTQISDNEEDFITGGALLDLNLPTEKYTQTCPTHKCNCGKFEGIRGLSSLSVCDNCKWARVNSKDSDKIYCLKQ